MKTSVSKLAVIGLGLMLLGGQALAAQLVWTKVTLLNGWKRYSATTAPPSVAKDANGIVYLKGAIYQNVGNGAVLFILPEAFRPVHTRFISTNLINGAPGRVIISLEGSVSVQAAGDYENAQGFTSLDGISFPLN